MHINYFGDVLWVSACAILTRNWYSAIIPALLFVFFVAYNIPKLDKYLRGKYGADFEEYSRRTKRFVPFVY
jgi:protein-S-isoprenylcysteine O-methyltransferase Ste14